MAVYSHSRSSGPDEGIIMTQLSDNDIILAAPYDTGNTVGGCRRKRSDLRIIALHRSRTIPLVVGIALLMASFLALQPAYAQEPIRLPLAVCGTLTSYTAPTQVAPGFISFRGQLLGDVDISYQIASGVPAFGVPVGRELCLDGVLTSSLNRTIAPEIVQVNSIESYLSLSTCGRNVTDFSGDSIGISGAHYATAPGALVAVYAIGQDAGLKVVMDLRLLGDTGRTVRRSRERFHVGSPWPSNCAIRSDGESADHPAGPGHYTVSRARSGNLPGRSGVAGGLYTDGGVLGHNGTGLDTRPGEWYMVSLRTADMALSTWEGDQPQHDVWIPIDERIALVGI
jgi:hypothetical protein